MGERSEMGDLLVDSTGRLLDELCTDEAYSTAREGRLDDAAWQAIEAAGLPLVLVPEEAGGLGVAPADAFALIRLCGERAAPFPIVETMLANAALAAAGLPLAEGPATIAQAPDARVAWGEAAAVVVMERDGRRARVATPAVETRGTNPAGVPRDVLMFDTGDEGVAANGPSLLVLGSLGRALQMAGALDRLLDMTIAHVSERIQFGRPLAKFQAIQQQIAVLAGEVAAASAAADMATEAYDEGDLFLAVAIARARIGEAAAKAAAIAHQLHGAIGFTREHPLHRLTTALWSWRDEFGTQSWWTRQIGARALEQGEEGYWPWVVAA